MGETFFAPWFHQVDAALFTNTLHLMPGLRYKKKICLNDIIDVRALKNMKSFSNGNFAAVKKESQVGGWLAVLKIALEWSLIVTNGHSKVVIPNDTEDFEPTKPVAPAKKKTTVVRKISEAMKRKKPAKTPEELREDGVDDDLHMVMALQISAMEEQRRQEIIVEEDADVEEEAAVEEANVDRSQVLSTPVVSKKKRTMETNRGNTAILDSDEESSFHDSPQFASTKIYESPTELSTSSHHSATPNASLPSPLSLSFPEPVLTGRKMVKLNDFTVSGHPDKALLNISNLSDKCQGKKKQAKTLKYGKPESESESDDDSVDRATRRKVEKAKMKPFEVKEALDHGKKIFTPVNLQIVGWQWDEKSEEVELKMSDSRFVYPMLLSSQFAWMVGPHLKTNTIVTVTEIKKKKGSRKPIIMHMMIDSKIQTDQILGNPLNMYFFHFLREYVFFYSLLLMEN